MIRELVGTGADAASRLQAARLPAAVARRRVVGLLVGAYVFGLVMVGLTPWVPPVFTTPPVVVAVCLVPGALLLLTLDDTEVLGAKWLAYSVGASLLAVMVLGLGLNLLLPAVGVGRPLALAPVVVGLTLLVALLAGIALRNDDDDVVHIPDVRPVAPAPLSFALLPLLTVLGVAAMNRTGENLPVVVVLAAVALVPLFVLARVDAEWHAFGLWTMALSVLYHDALAAGKTFPGNPVVVRTWRHARWRPGVNGRGELATELLQHGTLFPMVARLTGLDIMAELVLVNPVVVSAIPVALFVAYRRYVGSHRAFLAASAFVFAHPFYKQYPTAGRSATPVLFLALFAVTLADTDRSRLTRTALALLFLGGVATTHYGTAYFVMAALAGAVVGIAGLRLLEAAAASRRSGSIRGLRTVLDDQIGPRTVLDDQIGPRTVFDGPTAARSIFSPPLVAFFGVFVFSWFMYTNGGRAFELFPRHFTRILEQFLANEVAFGQGRTGARIERDYGSRAVSLSKRLYVLLAALMGVGLLGETLQRLGPDRNYRVDDAFVALGGVMLGLFGMTLVVRTWGGGRPMMIAFVFGLPFAVVGIDRLVEWAALLASRYPSIGALPADAGSGLRGFAAVLTALFVLNSGVAVAAGMDEPAPGGTPTVDDPNYQPTDVATHAWMIDHHGSGAIYGDDRAHGQTDWLLPAITLRTEGAREYGAGAKPRNNLDPLASPGAEPGYILILGHNQATGAFDRGIDERMALNSTPPQYRRNVVYTTGRSKIYYFNEST